MSTEYLIIANSIVALFFGFSIYSSYSIFKNKINKSEYYDSDFEMKSIILSSIVAFFYLSYPILSGSYSFLIFSDGTAAGREKFTVFSLLVILCILFIISSIMLPDYIAKKINKRNKLYKDNTDNKIT